MIVYTCNSSPYRSNLLKLQCTVPTTSGSPYLQKKTGNLLNTPRIYIYIYINSVRVCVCVCVCERKREREKKKVTSCLSVCVCVFVSSALIDEGRLKNSQFDQNVLWTLTRRSLPFNIVDTLLSSVFDYVDLISQKSHQQQI